MSASASLTRRVAPVPSNKIASDVITTLRTGRDVPPLFCFHPIEGSLGRYDQLVSQLPHDLPIYGVNDLPSAQYAGGADLVVRRYVEAIAAQSRGRSCRLLGYSYGAFLAMRVAAALEQLGRPVEFVAIIDWAPFGQGDAEFKQDFFAEYIANLHRHLCNRLSMLIRLPDDVLLQASQEIARRFFEQSQTLSLDRAAQAFRDAGFVAADAPEESLRSIVAPILGRLPLLKSIGLEPVNAPLHVWRAAAGIGVGSDAWNCWTSSCCDEYRAAGDHITVIRRPAVGHLARQFCRLL